MPLKKVGFQIYKGATPHFKNKQKIRIYHESDKVKISLEELLVTTKLKICSIKYQSNVKTFM